ncbi:MAG TPA: hypothetical protein VGW40_15515 [Allosphingosinicella sp.]|nr:hypothetical protein [Allosphingosinicella sp.]
MTGRRPIHVGLMSRGHGPLRNGLGFMAAVVLVPVAIVAKLLVLPFERPAKSSAAEVATALRDFLDGSGGDWDWDDFTSTPVADVRLEGIRRRASEVSLPLTSEGRASIERLLAEAERLAAQNSDSHQFREDQP